MSFREHVRIYDMRLDSLARAERPDRRAMCAERLRERESSSGPNQLRRDLACRRLKRSSCKFTGLVPILQGVGAGAGTLLSDLPQRCQRNRMTLHERRRDEKVESTSTLCLGIGIGIGIRRRDTKLLALQEKSAYRMRLMRMQLKISAHTPTQMAI